MSSFISLNVKSETIFIYIYILMFSVHVVIKFQGGNMSGGDIPGSPLCIKPCETDHFAHNFDSAPAAVLYVKVHVTLSVVIVLLD